MREKYTKALMKTSRCRSKSCHYHDTGYVDNCSKGIVTIMCEIRRNMSKNQWEHEKKPRRRKIEEVKP